ncbi:hypothetical protein DB347_14720 [Opitutaceae bacterium EW11]|nr:hypothetical protein DB347_14720 [Opitutaceae bacterium EW11]
MKHRRTEWERLVAAARLAPPTDGAQAPYGFATRVAAKAEIPGGTQDLPAFFARFSWRALSVAAVIMGAAVLTTFKPVASNLADVAASIAEPPVEMEEVSG